MESIAMDAPYEGANSIKISGRTSENCDVSYYIGPSCLAGTEEDLSVDDTVRLSFWVKSPEAGAIVDVFTFHKSYAKGSFAAPDSDSHVITRAKIPIANEWTHVEAKHVIRTSWTYEGTVYPPDKCHFYQLHFRLAESTADFYLDDVRLAKEPSPPSAKSLALQRRCSTMRMQRARRRPFRWTRERIFCVGRESTR